MTVLCGLPKGDRTDYIIQKCVEAGASEIAFFNCERCVARPETPEKKLERWQRIAEEAAKQSGRGIIPSVSWAGEFADALNIANQKELKLFLYETGEREGLDAVLEANKTAKTVALDGRADFALRDGAGRRDDRRDVRDREPVVAASF